MLTISELDRAAAIVHKALLETPQIRWPLLGQRFGAEVWVKHENHTPIGYRFTLSRDFTRASGLLFCRPGYSGQAVDGGRITFIVILAQLFRPFVFGPGSELGPFSAEFIKRHSEAT
jgi:hypothetical protein